MQISSLQWRALALLGALLSVILWWPFCCAARPITANPQPKMINRTDEFLKIILKNRTEIHQVNQSNIIWTVSKLSAIQNESVSEMPVAVLSRSHRSAGGLNNTKRGKRQRDADRNERSANLSHITGANRKIQLYIKNRFLQILPDGSINGTHDDNSDYSKYFYLI